jgi:ubiquinone biosynthesis protein
VLFRSPVERESIDGDQMVEDLLKAYMQQILTNGMVHVDPHPGNLHVTPAGNLVILDLGMVTHVSQEMRTIYAELFAAVGDGRGGDAADLALRLGEREADFDAFKWRNSVSGLVAQYQNTTLESIPVGRLMLQMSEIASQCGVRRPIEFSILGSTLLKLDRVIKLLAPDYNPKEFMRRHAPKFLLRQMSDAVSMGKAFTTFVESAELFSSLPRHGNDILSMLKQNQLQFKVDAIDESRLITGIQKIANRITMGLVVASMIIGAALLTNVETDFTIFGYPGVAMILFLAAVVFGAAQLVDILISDEHRPKRVKHGPKR